MSAFCQGGNGLIALQRLGFTRLEGVDLSPRLLAQFKGSANARSPIAGNFPSRSQQGFLIVQAACTISPLCRTISIKLFGNATSAAKERPRHVCRAVAHSLPDFVT